jgi:hypothetical protein
MQLRHDLELPRPETFYTKQLEFEVKVDVSVCGSFTRKDGSTFSLQAPTLLAPQLSNVHETIHLASLEEISEAALTFYRSGTVRPFSPSEYIDVLFSTRYQWGLAFEGNSKSSLKHSTQGPLHPEALRAHTEQFAYGLSIHFAAALLGISTDRFFFIDAAGSRPDFAVQVTASELASSSGGNAAALSPSGHRIQLEVKARTGWANYRKGEDGLDLLQNLSSKAASNPDFATISLVISLPSRGQVYEKHARILVADPGDPSMLNEKEQVLLLLEGSLTLLVRHGLWPTLSSTLQWLQELRGNLTENERSLEIFVEGYTDRPQKRIVHKEHGGRVYNGRIFSDVVLRLGRFGERGMPEYEARSRLLADDLGRAWFSGADKDWISIIQRHDAKALLSYGVGQPSTQKSTGHSAFLLVDEPMTEEIRKMVRIDLKNALQRW